MKSFPVAWRTRSFAIMSGLLQVMNASNSHGAGIAMIKQQAFHGDDSARPVTYSRLIDSHGPYIRIVSGGKDVQIGRSQLAAQLEMPEGVPEEILRDADCAPLRATLESYKAFSIRYPKSAPLLQPYITALDGHIAKFDAGQVRHEGVWMTGLDYAKIQAKQKASEGAARRQKEEDEAFAKAQRAKGLQQHDGKWLPKEEAALMGSGQDADLAAEISPIRKPDIESAKQAISNLTTLAARQSGAAKVRTERLLSVVKNLFAADFRLAEQVKACGQDELEAARQDQNAKNWLMPNAFGKTNEVTAREAQLKAAEIREKSSQRLATKKKELLAQLQEADAVVHEFHKLQEFGVVVILADAVQAISERSLPEKVFTPSFPESSLKEIRDLLRNRAEWLVTARNAETAENFEEAIRYYSKALDITSKKRCALQLARNFEEGKLPGSAIEYYEMGGDFKKASSLRQQNPDLRMEAFRKLDAEDLFSKVSPCCVRISNGNGLGSGFFFKRGGYILTNRHVVDSSGSIKVKLDDERTYEATLVAKEDKPDLAIIKIAMDDNAIIGFRTGDEVKIGAPVVLIGYPESDLPTATMNSGRISNTNRVFLDNPVYQLDVSANHGNSGGPVVDEAGRLVGILTFGLNDFNKDRFNFAITVDAIRSFVDEHLHE